MPKSPIDSVMTGAMGVGPMGWRPVAAPAALMPINLSRRSMLRGVAGTFVIGFALAGCGEAKDAGGEETVVADTPDASHKDVDFDLFITINTDGTAKLTCHRSEMGQQTWTAMAQILADELEADWSRIEIVQATGDAKYGDQNTDGSRSVRRNLDRLRRVGATVRHMLELAGADKLGVPVSEVRAELHEVHHDASGRSVGYGELAEAAATMPIPDPEGAPLKPREKWRYIGKPQPSLTVPKIVKGEGTFGQDVRLPDMVYAVVARPPTVFGKAASVDDSAALEESGVLRTVTLTSPEAPAQFKPLGGVAVIAKDTWSAIKGRNALSVEWDAGANGGFNSAAFETELMETARKPGAVRRNRGDVDAALAGAAKKVEADYYAPFLAHSAMEPPSATARWSEDGTSVEVWGCVQAPQAARATVAGACGIPLENVTIHVTWLGGGFGRKSKPDFFAEAALLSREVGKPLKVVWTREDDLQHAYYHAVSAQHMEGALDADGNCTAFLHRSVAPSIGSTFSAGADELGGFELALGASDNPFATPNLRLEVGKAHAHLRIGWLRSVCNIFQAFAVQSFACELAEAAGRDPKDYLLELIGPPRLVDPNTEGADYPNYGDPLATYPIDTGRLAHVTEVAAEMANWGRDLPEGHGLGIAAHRSFLTYSATVIEVAVDTEGKLSIVGVWSAMDAGTVVNTKHTAAQIEGGITFGLSNALYGEITATEGVVDQTNFPSWRLMRMSEAPKFIETRIIESDAPPAGVGEPGTPPAAPALANAIAAATGIRPRRLPIFGPDSNDRLPVKTEM